ncbi:MAG TPA: TonB-dependent receptor [Flavisolibacter sp.]|nr:TonB-dependent receptor [Flavisolibacter sp.]
MRKIFSVAAIIISSQLSAQQDSASLDEVVVTATKFPVKQSNTGKVISVITRQQIENSIGQDFSQLLNEQTGLTVSGANSNPGKDKSIFLRGAGGNYTLILLDGIPLNDPSGIGGSFDIRLISLEQIERIEILKGSQSTLYGANAIAGVINIISRKAKSEQTTGSGTLSYGSFNTFKGNAAFSRKGKIFDYNLNYEYFDTDGINEATDKNNTGSFDEDGFRRQSFSANLGFRLSEKIRLAPYFRYSAFKGEYDADAFTDGALLQEAELTNTGLVGSFGYKGGAVTVNYGYDKTRRDFNGYALDGDFHHAEAYVNHKLGSRLQLLAGLSYQNYQLPSPDTTNTLISPYASLVFQHKGWSIEAGGRYNKHNEYGDNFTYSFNPSYLWRERVKLFANVSSGFRAPSISELFGPFGANPNLKPEKSRSIEGGVQAFALNKRFSALATYFDRDIEDVIIYAFPAGYTNRDRQRDHGLEVELAFAPSTKWNFRATYAYVDGEITQKLQGKDTSFYNLIRRPKHTVNLFAGFRPTERLFVSTSVQSFSDRNDIFYDPATFEAVPVVLDAYMLWNAYAEYQLLSKDLIIFADVRNITNKTDYAEVYGYNVQGTNFNAGLRFKL